MKKKIVLAFLVFFSFTVTSCGKIKDAHDSEELQEATTGTITEADIDVEEAMKEMSAFIDENTDLMGTMIYSPVYSYDVTNDGVEDLCVTVSTGSGMVTFFVVVYDSYNHVGYMLDERHDFDYFVDGIEEDRLVVRKVPYYTPSGEVEKQILGTVELKNGNLQFVEQKEEMRKLDK